MHSVTDCAFDKQEIPFTKTGNYFLDNIPDVGNSALRVILVVGRKTVGFHKTEDIISHSQFEKHGGLSKRGAELGIQEAIEGIWIARRPVNPNNLRSGFLYRLILPGERLATIRSREAAILPSRDTKERKERPEAPETATVTATIDGYPDDRDPDVVNYHRKDPDNHINRASTDSYLNHELVTRATGRDAL